MLLLTSLVTASILVSDVVAHPGHDIRAGMAETAAFLQTSKRDLSHCATKMKARGIEQRSIARRAAIAKDARKKRNIAADSPYLKARDADAVLNITHLSSVSYSSSTNEAILFAGNNSCILAPEVTQGPYYVSGEYVRENIVEDQEGVELILDTQVIDVAICDPVTNTRIEIWRCNSTGVYSGIVASGNGDTSDTANINATFLRGLQATDADGVAQFTSRLYSQATTPADPIISTSLLISTAQNMPMLFFDQDLITLVEATSPDSTNTPDLTTNAGDSIFSQKAATIDPVVEYSLIGDDIASCIFGWIVFGIGLTSEQTLTAAASLYASGGVENSSSGSGAGGNATSGGNSTSAATSATSP